MFPINPISRFHGANTSIKRPTEIAYYSVDHVRAAHPFCDDQLRYYYPPLFSRATEDHASRPEELDLSVGFDRFLKRDEGADEHLEALLDTIAEYENRTGAPVEADVIAFRGQITKIMTAPFDRYADFEMNVACYQGALFIEENHSYRNAHGSGRSEATNIRQRNDQDRFQYWGYKFEQLATLPRPWQESTREEIENRFQQPCDNIAEYCSIVRTGIGGSTLVIGGEVDCVLGEKPDDPLIDKIPWIELKTSKRLESDRDALNFEQKMCRFWAQSFLLGVPTIAIGWRSRDGILLDIEEIATQRIPGSVRRDGKGSWDGNVCINFAASFFEFLRMTVKPGGEAEGVWRLEFKRGMQGIGIRQVETVGHGSVVSEKFKKHRERMAAATTAREQSTAREALLRLGTHGD